MSEFVANRLATGNRLFPAKVTIDDFGVTLKIPGLFSGEEKSLGFHQISSVKVDSPLLSFSKITFNTIGWDRIVAEGFEKADAEEIKALVQRGIAASRSGHQTFSSPTGPTAQVVTDPAAMAAAQAAIIASKAEQARIELERSKHEEEVVLKRKAQEAEDAKNRRRRADELRSQGRSLQALFVEFGTWIGIGAFALVVIGFVLVQNVRSGSVASDGAEINRKLELIENQLLLAMEAGDRSKALDLVGQLVHPLHAEWEDKSKWDTWSGFPYYDDWWTKKREDYKDRIMALPSTPTDPHGPAVHNGTIDLMPYDSTHTETNGSTAVTAPLLSNDEIASDGSVTASPLFQIEDPDGFSNLRDAPGGQIIRKVLPEERFEVLGYKNDHANVKLADGSVGFIHTSRVVRAN